VYFGNVELDDQVEYVPFAFGATQEVDAAFADIQDPIKSNPINSFFIRAFIHSYW
jgi:hypothetical protein